MKKYVVCVVDTHYVEVEAENEANAIAMVDNAYNANNVFNTDIVEYIEGNYTVKVVEE